MSKLTNDDLEAAIIIFDRCVKEYNVIKLINQNDNIYDIKLNLMINLIGISGKMQSGKNTVASIIQMLTSPNYKNEYLYKVGIDVNRLSEYDFSDSIWKQKCFADKLKDIVCLLIGCTKEQLESQEFKSSPLGNEWIRYGYADGFKHIYKGDIKITQMINKECSKEKYEEEYRVNWQTAYKHEFTPRELMQFIGTDLFRDKLLNNIWVNALFADYKPLVSYQGIIMNLSNNTIQESDYKLESEFPNWIITDMRFPNEVEAIKKRNGIVIRINRNNIDNSSTRESETALDNYQGFDWTLDNCGNIEDLIKEVRKMLIHFKII